MRLARPDGPGLEMRTRIAACADLIWVGAPDRARGRKMVKNIANFSCRLKQRMAPHGLERGLDRLDSVSVRIGSQAIKPAPPIGRIGLRRRLRSTRGLL